jgi:hypothetical protein
LANEAHKIFILWQTTEIKVATKATVAIKEVTEATRAVIKAVTHLTVALPLWTLKNKEKLQAKGDVLHMSKV